MTVSVRVYECVSHIDPDERFYARAIAMVSMKGGKLREGTSVGFYAATAEEADAKAHAWIEAERKRLADIGFRREERAAKSRKTSHEMETQS